VKAYNLTGEEREFNFGKMRVVSLGEKGRGRWEELIPTFDCEINDGEAVAVVTTRKGKPKIVEGKEKGNIWLARVSTEGSYIRGAYGWVGVLPEQKSRVEVVTKAYGAFGAAGRTGTWYDYLIKVEDNTLLRVKPSRGEAYYLFFSQDDVKKIDCNELDLFLDTLPDEVFGEVKNTSCEANSWEAL